LIGAFDALSTTNSDYGRHKSIEGVVPMSLLSPVALVDKDFDALARKYYLRCARHVLHLVPVKAFKNAVQVLEEYDREPSPENLSWLTEIYEELRNRQDEFEGFNSVAEFYRGLLLVLESVVFKLSTVSESDCIRFAEVAWLAAQPRSSSFVSARDEAFRKEMKYQDMWRAFILDGVAVAA
jgi:hypothetical protein